MNQKQTKRIIISVALLVFLSLIAWAGYKHYCTAMPQAERYVFIECPASYAIINNGRKTYVHKYFLSNIFKQQCAPFSGIAKERDNAMFQIRAKMQPYIGNLPNEYWNVSQPMVNEYFTYEEASKMLNIELQKIQKMGGNSLETFIYVDR